jgi:hypothetical protein
MHADFGVWRPLDSAGYRELSFGHAAFESHVARPGLDAEAEINN